MCEVFQATAGAVALGCLGGAITSLSSFVVLVTCNTKLNSKGCALARCKNSFFYLNTKMRNSLAYSIKKKEMRKAKAIFNNDAQ